MHKLIRNQLYKNKLKIILFLIIYMVYIILTLLEPVILGNILDMLINNNGIINSNLIRNIIILCTLLLSSYILYCLSRKIIYSTARIVKQGIYTDLVEKFEKTNINFFENVDKGSFISYIVNDINSLWIIVGHGGIEITRVILFTIIGLFISIKYIDLSLSISVFAIFPIFIYLIIRQNSKVQIATKETKDLNAILSKKINDGFCGFTVIKSYVKEEDIIDQFDNINKEMKEKNINYNKVVSKINVISIACQGISFSIACLYGIYLVTQNVITIGAFIAFNSIIQKIISDYIYAGNLVSKANELKIINNRIDFLYNTDTYLDGLSDMPKNPTIKIKDLNYKYTNANENILENINIEIPYGSFIGILGKTRCRKNYFSKYNYKII